MDEAEKIIARLGLAPLPGEGGWFRRTWTGAPESGGRPAGTAIYFLITPTAFSALHRLATDEVWHHYAGDPVELVRLHPGAAAAEIIVLGPDVLAAQQPQAVVPAGVSQGACLAPGAVRGWALLGCTLAPGWDERVMQLDERATLLAAFPGAAEIIVRLTRGDDCTTKDTKLTKTQFLPRSTPRARR